MQLALCCHSKPNPATLTLKPPACPFCRSCISRLVVADSKAKAVAVAGAGDEADEVEDAKKAAAAVEMGEAKIKVNDDTAVVDKVAAQV